MWYFSNRQVAQSLRLSGVSQVGRVEYSTASTFRKRSSVVSAKLAALGGVSFFRPQSWGPVRPERTLHLNRAAFRSAHCSYI